MRDNDPRGTFLREIVGPMSPADKLRAYARVGVPRGFQPGIKRPTSFELADEALVEAADLLDDCARFLVGHFFVEPAEPEELDELLARLDGRP